MSSKIIGNLLDLLQVYGLSVLEPIMSVPHLDIIKYFSPFVALDVSNLCSASDD